MKNLEEAIKYTLEKKAFQIKDPYASYQKRIEDIQKYLIDEKSRTSAILNVNRLSTWYLWNFIYTFLKENKVDYTLLAKSTYYGVQSNNVEYLFGKLVETYDDAIPFTDSIKHLAQMLYLGWRDKAKAYGELVLKMLYGKQYDGWVTYPTHPWFMLEIYCKWQNITLDYDKLRYPESLGVYQKALDHWNTQDTQLLSTIIDELTEFRIQQSDEYVKTDEYGNEFSPEFTSANYFIFAIEILMWLSIRRIMGLPEYTPSPENKLMQLEINKLPVQSIPYPKDELVQQVKTKLLTENPNIDFELNF